MPEPPPPPLLLIISTPLPLLGRHITGAVFVTGKSVSHMRKMADMVSRAVRTGDVLAGALQAACGLREALLSPFTVEEATAARGRPDG